jgi:hypothetical protein
MPGLRLFVDTSRAEAIKIGFAKVSDTVQDFRPFWTTYFAGAFYADLQENFRREGGLVGGWAALSPRYAAWKAAHAPGRGILELTGVMREALSAPTADYAVFDAQPRSVRVGVSGPVADRLRAHQEGLGRLPTRTVLFVDNILKYQLLMKQWALEQIQREVPTVATTTMVAPATPTIDPYRRDAMFARMTRANAAAAGLSNFRTTSWADLIAPKARP